MSTINEKMADDIRQMVKEWVEGRSEDFFHTEGYKTLLTHINMDKTYEKKMSDAFCEARGMLSKADLHGLEKMTPTQLLSVYDLVERLIRVFRSVRDNNIGTHHSNPTANVIYLVNRLEINSQSLSRLLK